MTTTATFKCVNSNSRSSFQVLWSQVVGSLGFRKTTEHPVWKNKMASNVSGKPQENPPSLVKTAGAKSSGAGKDLELPETPRSISCETSSGNFLDPMGESEMHENVDTNFQDNLGRMTRSLCSLALCPALWTWPQCHPGETLLAASLTWS